MVDVNVAIMKRKATKYMHLKNESHEKRRIL
jgi:hypothetical protein